MKLLAVLIVLILAGCASDGPYRPNAFSPKKGPDCPEYLTAVCEVRIGKTICACVEWQPREFPEFNNED